MRKKVFVLLFCLFPLMSFASVVLVLGDSISAGYGIAIDKGWVRLLEQQIEKKFPGKYRVVNASISGDTTAGGLNRLPQLLEKHTPSHVIVELGGNDGLRGLSLNQLEKNLSSIIDQCLHEDASIVLLNIDLPASYGIVFVERFRAVYARVAEEKQVANAQLGVELLDGNMGLIQADGIHPTAEAQPILLDAVWPLLDLESQKITD